ncbi:MAG: hypothetical protein R3B81_17000 [bacterium]
MSRALVAAVGAALLLAAGSAQAEWQATQGDLGRSEARAILRAGGAWAGPTGGDVDKTKPGVNYQAAAAYRVWGMFSVCGSFATGSFDVDGQVVSLIGQYVRSDLRSGNVSGSYEPQRLRLGLRFEALRTETSRVVPYLEGGALFTTTKFTIDSVDRSTPGFAPNADGEIQSVAQFERSTTGAFLRGGVEWLTAGPVGVYTEATFDAVSIPAGLHSIVSVGAGISLRPL